MPKTHDEPQISATMTRWAVNLGMHRDALKRRLVESGIPFGDATELTAADVFKACYGDKERSITRLNLAKAEEQERENKVAEGQLLELPQIEKKLWVDLLSPLRLLIEQMPESLAGMCNPESPEVAKNVLRTWTESTKLQLKEPK